MSEAAREAAGENAATTQRPTTIVRARRPLPGRRRKNRTARDERERLTVPSRL
jgi:hypothetical protein